jgi:hypothetical protein
MTELAPNFSAPVPEPPDLADTSACLKWLRERYMKNARDTALDDRLKEILETDCDGNLTAVPQRNGLIQEVRGRLIAASFASIFLAPTANVRRECPFLEE